MRIIFTNIKRKTDERDSKNIPRKILAKYVLALFLSFCVFTFIPFILLLSANNRSVWDKIELHSTIFSGNS